jgi:hypothetical protein
MSQSKSERHLANDERQRETRSEQNMRANPFLASQGEESVR